ncbi:phosphoribosylaminoimidazolesuccinocarboxamide synthase [Candidatus Peregrinibacteria bacterium]|nr:phosphoribosylaminoimidazolesuccinocarboxamide synthase [Candidatus Peregrinibacteria bacterium]
MFSLETIRNQIPYCLKETHFKGLSGGKYEGKVRDNYIVGDKRILIASDRLSAFDRIITTIPFKGEILNLLTKFWFEKTSDIVKNHAIAFPDPNVTVAWQCQSLPIEIVVRGYLTGVTSTSAWYHYERGARNFCGNILPEGMKKNQKFDQPIITPSTKAEHGAHDESLSPEEILKRGLLDEKLLKKMMDIAMKLYLRGREICAKQGMIFVDTKYEFGLLNKELILIDEIHTPDSSRFWFENTYQELFEKGEEQKKIDKEYMRQWLKSQGFTGDSEIPQIPDEIRGETARRYIEAFELITGTTFHGTVGNVGERIEKNLREFLKNSIS